LGLSRGACTRLVNEIDCIPKDMTSFPRRLEKERYNLYLSAERRQVIERLKRERQRSTGDSMENGDETGTDASPTVLISTPPDPSDFSTPADDIRTPAVCTA
jgi:hypothetical protein